MAKRARPEPEITERWTKDLSALAVTALKCREDSRVAEEDLKAGIRGAFSEHVLVGDIKNALCQAGLDMSGSRIYQIKFELRDKELAAKADVVNG